MTSSIRLDRRYVNIGPATTFFHPTTSTKIFLDFLSIELAKSLLDNPEISCSQSLPSLYQLKQVRSKTDSLSTYTMCRSSSTMNSPFKTSARHHLDVDRPRIQPIHRLSQKSRFYVAPHYFPPSHPTWPKCRSSLIDDFKSIQSLSKDSFAVASILHNIYNIFMVIKRK